ncbi:MAG: alpha/beta hydrolase [Eubacteriales bacterium]|nr:alpha/beta hydrolase [Eubacteriales bacterium]
MKTARHPALGKALRIFLTIVLLAASAIALYAYDNLSYQDRLMDHVWQAGYAEAQVTLPNGTVLNYGEGGPQDAPALLMLHGQQVEWTDYARVLPQLAKQYHVYAIDCHGHGKSSHDAARYTCAAMTEDFVWFIRNVIGGPCLLTGHSSGGVLAANIAATAPELARGLLIEDAPFYCFQPDEMRARSAFVLADSFEVIHRFLNQSEEKSFTAYYFENGYLWPLFGGLSAQLAADARAQELARPDQPVQLWYMPASMMNAVYHTCRYDLAFGEAFYDGSWFDGLSEDALLSAIQCPTVYLKAKTVVDAAGTLLCANTVEDAQRVTELIAGCERVTLESNEHDIHFVNPDAFLDGMSRLASRL